MNGAAIAETFTEIDAIAATVESASEGVEVAIIDATVGREPTTAETGAIVEAATEKRDVTVMTGIGAVSTMREAHLNARLALPRRRRGIAERM